LNPSYLAILYLGRFGLGSNSGGKYLDNVLRSSWHPAQVGDFVTELGDDVPDGGVGTGKKVGDGTVGGQGVVSDVLSHGSAFCFGHDEAPCYLILFAAYTRDRKSK
jgi:hypothetical protein